ncbi:hypothetical protein Q3W71_15165 [Micromonospora sp. C28SCA-DRY-2]|uniref:hypothetical protein n=1 Tax=Micromonospora sp. C28SCA-DRY-2 TaxID=3059522 RepID=UPI002676EB7A|nr:hypothetical protein [Micromonospora sp. C28SCA-DRY-2]MDO3703010.1 hypothetical protein [Micromonospora sp. C28SCA-DRY-2]
MTGTRSTGVRCRLLGAAVAVAGLLAATGCEQRADTAEPVAEPAVPATPAAMRLDKPKLLLDRWAESANRNLHAPAQHRLGEFKKLLAGEPTSAVGTAYVTAEEAYSPELGVHLPDGGGVVLVSGVSGTVGEPEAVLDAVFAGLPAVAGVAPTAPGPLGGVARCGTGRSRGVHAVVCAWADDHTVATVTFLGFPATGNRAEDFRRIRSQLEHPAR